MFKNLEDCLPLGKHIIKVYKAQEWSNGGFVEGSHKRTKPNKAGISGYMYSTDIKYFDEDANKERRCNLFAYDKDKKELLDGGEVEVNIVEYCILEDGKLATSKEVEEKELPVCLKKNEDGLIVPATKKRVFVNKVKNEFNKIGEYDNPAFEQTKDYGGDEPRYEDIPF